MPRVLIIDSCRAVRNTLRERLEYEGYAAVVAETSDEGVRLNGVAPFDVLLTDGLDTGIAVGIPFIYITPDTTVETAVAAVKAGAADIATKPIDMNHLLEALRRICESTDEQLPQRAVAVRKHTVHIEEIIGESPAIAQVKRLIDRVAPSEARVLIMGANGTGKELVARWLHEKSSRRDAPFVEVNCAAIPSELIESELFGHEKGAFTSAIKQRHGKFEQADGGTLFMDEIGDMSLSAQAKVLRALQENKISRVGSDKDIDVNVRVIAATNKNLNDEIERGHFREDLYHRLSVIIISVPPLSARRDDIPMLINYFLDKICAEYNVAVKQIEPQAVERLSQMEWRGNIRELRNVVERLIILSGDCITLDDVEQYVVAEVLA